MSRLADNLHILVIEDDELDRLIIGKALRSTGLCTEIDFAEDSESGFNSAAKKKYSCIFLDYNLPGSSGLLLLKKFREAGIPAPVIIITSQGDERVAVELMKNGAADYIPKGLLTTEGTTQVLRQIFRVQESEHEKAELETEVRSSNKLLETIAANAPVILFSLDTKGVLTSLNGKAAFDFGNAESNYIGREISEIESLIPVSVLAFKKAAAGISIKETSERHNKYFEVHYSPMRNASGEITGVTGVAIDITYHKVMEEMLRSELNANEELARLHENKLIAEKSIAEEAVRVRQEFLANISHEIRTPMTGIIGLAEILSKTKLNAEQKKHLMSIITCSENLLLILNDILDYSKIESGRMTFEKMPFSLHEVIENSLSIFSNEAAIKNIELSSAIKENVPEIISGDSLRLSQVLNNLLGNAIKFTPSGSVSLTIGTANENEENITLVFGIKDTGIRIPHDKQKIIFESFIQAGSDTSRKFGGTGLGLAIVKKIVELQGGTIKLKSAIAKGSEFIFSIPFTRATEEEKRALKETSLKNLSADLSNLNILSAEDNEMSRMILQKHLSRWNSQPQFARNGKEAVELLKQNHFDLILMDIQMPEMDGYQATRIIRGMSDSKKASVPIIGLTAHATDAERIKCMECGMNDYLSKPYRAEELLFKITENCSNKTISLSVNTNAVKQTEFIMEETPSIIDLQYLKRVAEDEADFIRDMIAIFFKRTPEAIAAIRQGLSEGKPELVWQTAHRMKPSFSYMGMTGTSALAAKLEKLYKTSPDKTQAEELLATIENNFTTAQALIEKEFLVTK
jgi:PAS domain S-box-containing protein